MHGTFRGVFPETLASNARSNCVRYALALSSARQEDHMADLSLTLTCADYARLAPLMSGDVKPEGIHLALVHGTGGSWPARADMLSRALQDPEVQGGEASM